MGSDRAVWLTDPMPSTTWPGRSNSRLSPYSPAKRHRNHIRHVIEERTGRPLSEIVRELYREQAQTPDQVACFCSRLAGEDVAIGVVEAWLNEFDLIDREERWAAMVPRLHRLLDELIAEEADRRVSRRFIRKD